MKTAMMAMAVAGMMAVGSAVQAKPFEGRTSQWQGYTRHDFVVDGRKCRVVLPREAAPGLPWIWRARFFGHQPQADLALLERGYHLVYMDVANLFGAPSAVSHWNAFYEYLTGKHGFARKVALEGMSRGGLIIYNWAKASPDKVSCIYGDNPVCDIRSWPGGKGKGKSHAPSWQACLRAYVLTEEQAADFDGNPIDGLGPLAEAGVPLLNVCGETDEVVPVSENTLVLADRYRKLGGEITVIMKPHNRHHPHSLEEPARIVNFVLDNTPGMDGVARLPAETPYGYDYFTLRGGLPNCRVKFEREKKGCVAFLGGSITAMRGWRDLVCRALRQRFPDTEFDFINAGIGSTGSIPGAFRLRRDVFGCGSVDLLFEEAAVNDATNRPDRPVEWLRGMEGIVRQARLTNPAIDIVLMHFVDPGKMKTINEGRVPGVIAVHEKVARHYGVPSINLAREVTERIHAGEFTWKGDFKNLHPSPFGHQVYLRSIERLFDAAWNGEMAGEVKAHAVPAKPLDEASYFAGRLVDVGSVRPGKGWRLERNWHPSNRVGTRPGFVNVPMLIAEEPGALVTFDFRGTAAGIFVAAGDDAGTIEYCVDGGEWRAQDLFTRWSRGLHIPWAHVLAAGLPPGEHQLAIRIAETRNKAGKGHACRIAHWLVNGGEDRRP